MSNNHIVIWTSPTVRFQKIFIYKEGELVSQLGVTVEDLNEILIELMDKYNIKQLDFSGTHSYARGLVKSFQESNPTLKFDVNNIRINYV